ncbi:MAG: ATP synthase F0 subunit B, partial [Desulfomonile tiedjei]|nr:ATP synthase F0 subunit B [Desulfomonile tiedjei]
MKHQKTALVLLVLPAILLATDAFAASEGSPWTTGMLLWRVINTVALLAILVYVLKKPLGNFFTERKAQIQMDLEQAREQRDLAEVMIKDYQQKLAGMEQELDKMRAELKKSSDAESAKVIANSERMAASMAEAAKVAAEQEVRKAKIELKNEAVALAIELAESLIREKINDDDRKKLVEEYFVKVGGM